MHECACAQTSTLRRRRGFILASTIADSARSAAGGVWACSGKLSRHWCGDQRGDRQLTEDTAQRATIEQRWTAFRFPFSSSRPAAGPAAAGGASLNSPALRHSLPPQSFFFLFAAIAMLSGRLTGACAVACTFGDMHAKLRCRHFGGGCATAVLVMVHVPGRHLKNKLTVKYSRFFW